MTDFNSIIGFSTSISLIFLSVLPLRVFKNDNTLYKRYNLYHIIYDSYKCHFQNDIDFEKRMIELSFRFERRFINSLIINTVWQIAKNTKLKASKLS